MEDIINSMHGSQWFSEIDLQNAYHQLPLNYESSLLTTIATPFGLYRYTVMPFGIKQAPAIFQSYLEKLLCGIEGVEIYQDNVYIHGKSRAEHDERLGVVQSRMRKQELKVNEAKSHYAVRQLSVLGTVINGTEAWPDPAKADRIKSITRPRSVREVRSFLGFVEFYGKFIPDLATIKEPLTKLLRQSEHFVWVDKQQKSFEQLKEVVTANNVLHTFDPKAEVVLKCDASPVGIGAVIEQHGHPVIFVSKTLAAAERGYAQIEREALAIVWAVRRLHKYLFGRKFTLYTDHKPLQFIFEPSKPVPMVAAA